MLIFESTYEELEYYKHKRRKDIQRKNEDKDTIKKRKHRKPRHKNLNILDYIDKANENYGDDFESNE